MTVTQTKKPYTPGQYFREELGYFWLFSATNPKDPYYKVIYDPVTYSGFTEDLANDKTDAIIDPESFKSISNLTVPYNPRLELWVHLSKAKYQ